MQPTTCLPRKRKSGDFTMDEVDMLLHVHPGSPAFLTETARQEIAQQPSKVQSKEDAMYYDRQKKLKKRKTS